MCVNLCPARLHPLHFGYTRRHLNNKATQASDLLKKVLFSTCRPLTHVCFGSMGEEEEVERTGEGSFSVACSIAGDGDAGSGWERWKH